MGRVSKDAQRWCRVIRAAVPKSNTIAENYKASGVDIAEADAGLRNITSRITATWPSAGLGAVQLPIGYFANIVDIGAGMGLGICTDGVGSKAIIAQAMNKYDTIGVDCVAMHVNDLLCVGARPLSRVDYISVQPADRAQLDGIAVRITPRRRE